MLRRELIEHVGLGRLWLGAAAATGALALAVALQAGGSGGAGAAPRQVAIRIDCAADPDMCEVAQPFALDVWSEAEGAGVPLDIVVAESALPALDALGVRWDVLVPDVEAQVAAEHARLAAPSPGEAAIAAADWFAEYRDYEAITAHLRELAAAAPGRAEIHAIGSTLDAQPIWALRIGPRDNSAPDAVPMLVDGTQHAREWLAAMVTTCVADRLVRDYDRDPAVKEFVDHTALWVVPVVNPDGYRYSWSQRRLWRKNRRGGFGVDLNRNFGVGWGGRGASASKSAENYRGEREFSEPESAAIRDLASREHIALDVDFHTYSQLVLYPWGYTAAPAKDKALLAAVGDKLATALYAQHQVSYKLIQSVELYPASGNIIDWTYGALGALSYTIELRPGAGRGAGGFVQPPSEIRPTCDEGFAAVLALRAAKR